MREQPVRVATADVVGGARDAGGVTRLARGLTLLAFVLRLATGLGQDHRLGYELGGSDSTAYLAQGYALASGFERGRLAGYGVDVHPEGMEINLAGLVSPPLYPLFLGIPQALFMRETAVLLIRVAQAALGAATVWLVWRLGRRITGDARAGLVAAAMLALSPAFIYESAQIASETLYITLLLAALAQHSERPGRVALTGLLLGLATLTRAVLLLFPLGLALHLLCLYGRREGLRRAALLLGVYVLVVGSWSVYNLARWERFVIAGEGLAAFLYISALEDGWQGGHETDMQLLEDTGELPKESAERQGVYLQGAWQRIGADLTGHVARRLRELGQALTQPYGTNHYEGPALRLMAQEWLREGGTPGALLRPGAGENFWPRLLIYAMHFGGLALGLAGMWLMRGRWRATTPAIGLVVYTLLAHLTLHAIPRYLFPTLPLWWIFAGATISQAGRRLQGRRV